MLHGGKKAAHFWTLTKLPAAAKSTSNGVKFTQVAARNTHILAISSTPLISLSLSLSLSLSFSLSFSLSVSLCYFLSFLICKNKKLKFIISN
jgi:hypothetical protein